MKRRVLLALSCLAAPARAAAWPLRPIRMISPFPGGTVVDATSRLYAAGLGDRLGQPVIVENRPGGEGVIATQAFLQLADDHKLLFSFAGPVTVNPLTIERLPYDPAHLLPISTAALDVIGIAAAPDFPAVDLRAAVALARARPGGLSWASAPGAVGLSFEAFLATERLDLARANYRSGVEAMTDLSQSRIALAVLPFGTIRPHLEAGRARLLAVTNPQRTAVAPEVATAAEQGFPNYVFEGFVGLFGPPDMPGERRLRISMTMRDIAADPALRARLEKGGQEARGSTPEEMAQRIAAQRAQVAAGLAARATR